MPLAMVSEGEEKTVKKVLAGEREKRHFESLGIAAGASLTVLACTGGNVIVRVRGVKIALNKGMAMKIIV